MPLPLRPIHKRFLESKNSGTISSAPDKKSVKVDGLICVIVLSEGSKKEIVLLVEKNKRFIGSTANDSMVGLPLCGISINVSVVSSRV